ncbi:MAG: hypothetical protein GAK29_04094 [Acinetobacter bereziniae]|uniref:Leucine-rich repeat domain-containing protein n=1 Tax=Acinetobacter bereziniae TaxID=106648 RepID=A0A833PBC6_ACIBZ|nr:MAG: hypothetical protein GAK29_04094 [Acinetobacter bereziniae]
MFLCVVFFFLINSSQEFDVKVIKSDETIELYRSETKGDGFQVSDLIIQGQNITTLPKGTFRKFLFLKTIDIQATNLTTIEAKAFENLPKLRILNLSLNRLKQIKKYYFENLPITHLYLFGNVIERIQVGSFYNLKSLEVLDLSRNKIQHLDFHMFKGTYYLQQINLSFNKITMLPHQCFFDAFSSVALGEDAYLDLSDNQISYISSKSISGIYILEKLDLKNNLLEQLDPNLFKHFHYLGTLDLENNFLRSLSNNNLEKLERTQEINLLSNPWNCGFVKKYRQWCQRFNKFDTLDVSVVAACNRTN